MNVEQMKDIVNEYVRLRDEKALIEKRMAVLSKEIKEYSTQNGTKDDKGSYYCEDDNYVFGNMSKKSVSFDSNKLIAYLEEKGYNDAIIFKKDYDEKVVEKYVDSGDISQDDLEQLVNVKVSNSLYVKAKEKVEDVVEQTKVSKKNLFFKKRS